MCSNLVRLLVAATVLASANAWAAPCPTFKAGLDTTHYDWSHSTFLGSAIGQTFFAPETLITKLTIWRPASNRSMIAAHLYVTAADTAASPRPVPLTHEILLDGPTVGVFDSDPPGQIIPMVFVVDPPLVLPHKGIYAWFLQPENCAPAAAWYVCADTSDSYPSGDAWTTIRTFGECHLPTLEGMEDHQDYIFEVQYCDAAVPTRRRTWGELKLIYR